MCYSGCPYERFDGSCKGRPKGELTAMPHCFEQEDLEAYNESVNEDKILAYELDRCDRQDWNDNQREDRRINR